VVFVRKRAPEIQYLKASISEEQRRKFGRLVEATVDQILAGEFPSWKGYAFSEAEWLWCQTTNAKWDSLNHVYGNLRQNQSRWEGDRY